MLVLALALASTLVAEPLQAAPIARFDGDAWSSIRLNRDTDADIKRAFRTEKGAVRPEALKIVTDRPRDVRVDALLDGRGGKATVRAIRVEYAFQAPPLTELEEAFGEKALDYYLPGRNDNWRLSVFPQRGVVAYSLNGIASVFYLASSQGVARLVSGYQTRETRIETIPDPGKGWDRTVKFRDSDVTLYLGKNAPSDFDDAAKRRIRDHAQRTIESLRNGTVQYAYNGGGSLSATIRTGKFNGRKADCTVSVSFTGKTPYGRIDQSASDTDDIEPNYREGMIDILDDALSTLNNNVTNAIRKMGPPTPEQTRESAMQRLYSALAGA